jgi:branched-chain amino acid aminotransferase
VICSPVGPYFKSAGFSAIKILAEDSFVRAWPGGTGEFKIGANYGPTILPQKLAGSKGFQQILWLLGKDLEITEIGSMNCFILLKEHENSDKLELVTPPLTDGTILPGVTRDSILKMTRKWNEFKVSERSINMAEFLESHAQNRIVEMFGAGTAAIVSPIKCMNFHGKDYEIPLNPLEPEKQAGPLTERLFKLITQIQVNFHFQLYYLLFNF